MFAYAMTRMNEGFALDPINCADAAKSKQNNGMMTSLCDCSLTTVKVAIGATRISVADT